MSWKSVTCQYPDTLAMEYHVVPNNDLREHECAQECWCHPTKDDDFPNIFTHHSMDLREQYENGRSLS